MRGPVETLDQSVPPSSQLTPPLDLPPRRRGWTAEEYQQWSDHLLADGVGFVVPTSWNGETVLRLCVVNPRTTIDDIQLIIDSLA